MGKKKRRRKSTDLLEILEGRFFESDDARAELEEARAGAQVARLVYSLRTEAGLTRRELAARVGTKHTVIGRLESDDYEGHSLSMLRRIAKPVGLPAEQFAQPVPATLQQGFHGIHPKLHDDGHLGGRQIV